MSSQQNNLKNVGKVMDAHGIRGDIYCLIFSGDVSWINKIKKLNLKGNTEIESFNIKKIKAFKRGFIATLEGFNDRNKAEEYKGAELWVEADLFVSEDGESLYLSEILNFELHDEKLGLVGTIQDFSSNGVQDLLIVENENSEFEIPFVKEFVISMDFDKQSILMNLPDGLLQINDKDYDKDAVVETDED
jgi:16S rRNA processing protein RimM